MGDADIPVIARSPVAEHEPEYREMSKYQSGAADQDAAQVKGAHAEPWLNVLDASEPASPQALEFALSHPSVAPLVHGRVIDLGAGTCWTTARLSQVDAIGEVVALDMSERFLTEVGSRIIRARGGDTGKIRFAVGSFNDIPLPSASFDCAFLVAAIHHSLSPLKALMEARRVLKPGGALMVVETPSSVVGIASRRRAAIDISRSSGATELCYTTGEIDYMLRHAGFEEVSYFAVDGLTRGGLRHALRLGLRALGLEDLLKPPIYLIVARGGPSAPRS